MQLTKCNLDHFPKNKKWNFLNFKIKNARKIKIMELACFTFNNKNAAFKNAPPKIRNTKKCNQIRTQKNKPKKTT